MMTAIIIGNILCYVVILSRWYLQEKILKKSADLAWGHHAEQQRLHNRREQWHEETVEKLCRVIDEKKEEVERLSRALHTYRRSRKRRNIRH